MSSITKHYRNEFGHHYEMEFRPEADGTWSIWALDSPPNPHGGSATVHHLYESGRVCVDSSATPRTLERAIAIAIYWMNRYSTYCRTGEFPKTSGRVNV